MVTGGSRSNSATGDTAVATRAAAVKEDVDVATEEATEKKKSAEEAAMRKMAAEEAAAKKKATEEAAVKKAIEEAATKKKVIDEAVTKKKASEEAAKKTESGAETTGYCPSPALLTGVKRAAAPSGSTPLAKPLFHGSWKPRYATRPLICHFLYRVYDFNLVSSAYSVPSSGRSPPSRGANIAGAAQIAEPQDIVEAQPSEETVGGGGVPVIGAAVAAGAAT
jgi:hypothetical protein